MNKISNQIKKGTLGELLVQLRLLQFGIQAAPPIKDSGNDLIAVRGEVFKAIQVKTTTTGSFRKPNSPIRHYHILAVVELNGNGKEVYLDQSRVFLIPRDMLTNIPTRCNDIPQKYLLNEPHLYKLFHNKNSPLSSSIKMAKN